MTKMINYSNISKLILVDGACVPSIYKLLIQSTVMLLFILSKVRFEEKINRKDGSLQILHVYSPHSAVCCWVLISLSFGDGDRDHKRQKDREGSDMAQQAGSLKRQPQRQSNDERNMDYCISRLNPLTSHHSVSLHRWKTKPWNFFY